MTESFKDVPQGVDIAALSVQQLGQVKKQLDEELEHLTSSFTKLRAAQSRFRECIKVIDKGILNFDQGKEILVPLTTSLYVRGTIADMHNVVVDVGTGFYVEKNTADALAFYRDKTEELGGNLKSLESIMQQRSNNLRIVEDVLRQKVIANNAT